MSPLEHTVQVLDWIRERTDSVILFYSGGKDSITMLDLAAPKFRRVVCVYMYFVPNMDHIRRYIEFSKLKYPNVEFAEVPHWNLTYALRSGLYCEPHPEVKLMKFSDVANNCRVQFGIDWCLYGHKISDNLHRRVMLRGKGYIMEAIHTKTHNAYPLSHWGNNEVLAYIRQHRLPDPVRYSARKKSQGLTFDEDCFRFMREHWPDDLRRILEVFPLAEVILYRLDHPAREE